MPAVIGIDDAVILAIGAAGLLLAKRNYNLEHEFLEEHEDQIERENQRIVYAWRASRPKKRRLKIIRTFKLPGILTGYANSKRKYKR